MKKNFAIDEPVILRGFGNDKSLEGATGTILGKSFDHAETDFYIVLLDTPLPTAKAICMTESCIYPQTHTYDSTRDVVRMTRKLVEESYRVKVFVNQSGFDVTSGLFVIAKRYRDELKAYIRALRDNT